ncbi:AAA domain-containing protein [Acinetobacter sichuanensis]|uniref:AAA domain-containing protein n=1 Tax=Acinetobacter sichuanensis TaxID=2136183 RepID=UPI00280DEBDF|nr:AAA domain-containing protein [Acinetobacter sichuanensis]MDQ9021907.1 AAA domain-containing protein [Acinetobacter sichuanensis]
MGLNQKNILKAWQHYIEITGCEKSKIPVKNIDHCQIINFKEADFNENISSKGVFIELYPDQIAHLTEKYVVFDQETNENRLSEELIFSFPLLNIHHKNESFYLPIFTIDLPSNFLLENDFTGFDISSNVSNMVKVNLAVLLNYFDVEIDDLDESRNILELMSLVCDRPFPDFKTLYFGFLDWANERLASKNNNFKSIYFAPHTHGLIYATKNDDAGITRDLQDFKHILGEIESDPQIIAKKYPLLNEYLTKNGDSTSIVEQDHITLNTTYGLFESKYSLGRGQYQAIQVANIHPANPLIAVQGAPGTGKTTLFKSLIAQQVSARALAIIEGADRNMNMLVCSTAVKAVDNVIADLKSDPFTQNLDWLWFHGGSNAKIGIEIEERLKRHINRLSLTDYDDAEYSRLKQAILQAKNRIDQLSSNYLSAIAELGKRKADIAFLTSDCALDDVFLRKTLQQSLQESSKQLDLQYQSNVYSHVVLKSYVHQLENEVSVLLDDIQKQKEALNHVKNLLAYWPNKFTPSQFSDWMLNVKVRGNFPLSIGDFFKLQFLKFITMFSPAKINLKAACEILNQHDQLESWEKRYEHNQKQLEVLDQMLNCFEKLEAYIQLKNSLQSEYQDCSDLTDVLRIYAIKDNREIFELSVQFIFQEQLKRKDDVVTALSHWSAMLEGGGNPTPHFGRFIKEAEAFYRDISLAYPVVATTLTSAYKMSAYKHLKHLNSVKPWSLARLDEAGMVSVENLLPIVARSTKAMIVGDPLQLEPIRTISKNSIQKIYKEYFANHDEDYAMLGPGQVTAYHRAAGTQTGEISDIGDGIILDEHRRCQAPIAQLFIDIAKYKGLNVSTFKPSDAIQKCFDLFGGHHLMFYHVDGMRTHGKTNLDEINAIGELLNELNRAGYNLKSDIGIITPYADQKHLLIKAFGNRMEQDKLAKIGTIHQFQGVGFEVIIFSSVIFDQKDSSNFLNSRPNMLNVTVSRAKQQFIVVGNYHKLKESRGSLGLIANRCSAEFYLELGLQSKNYDELANSFNVERHIHDAQHIKAFEYYLENAVQSITIVVPWIRKPYNMRTQKQLELLKAAKNRGVSITVFYGYSNLEINQKDDNDQALVQEYIQALGSNNVIRLPQGTHEKVLLIDDRILIVGSWNWLSNAYYKWYSEDQNQSNLAIRRETSVIIMDRKIITQYKAHNLLEVTSL